MDRKQTQDVKKPAKKLKADIQICPPEPAFQLMAQSLSLGFCNLVSPPNTSTNDIRLMT